MNHYRENNTRKNNQIRELLHKPVERTSNHIYLQFFLEKIMYKINPAEGFSDSNTSEHAIKRYIGFTNP